MAAQAVSLLSANDSLGRFPALDEAVKSLVSATFVAGRFRIDLPIVMPSGSSTSITVWPEPGDSFMVTDDAAAWFEVTSSGFSEALFSRVAKELSQRYGATFDGESMFYLRVGPNRLRGAIIAMANLVKEVVDETVLRSINQKARQIDLELWDKLDRAFPGHKLERKAHFMGESTALHEFTAMLTTENGAVLFDTFSAQGNSINSVYVKMADVQRGESPPKGVAVTKQMASIGPKLNLITSVAQVVEIDLGIGDLQKIALAA